VCAGKLISGMLSSAVLVAGCATTQDHTATEQLDHVILAISDLGRGIEQLGELCGVLPVHGGKHPQTGTENALLSMGSGAYTEVLAPQEGVELAPEYQPLRAVPNLIPVGWAVSTRNAGLTIQKLRTAGFEVSEPQAGSRQTPVGNVLRWQTFQVTAPKIASAPFFIEWDSATAHPSKTSPVGCPLKTLELRTPHDEELRGLLRLLALPGDVTRSETPGLAVTLEGTVGPTRLPSAN
jgi:hypothetical protein